MSTANSLPRRGHVQSAALPKAEKSPAPHVLPLRERLTKFVARASRFAERPPAIRYSAALAAVFLALSVRLVLDPWFGDRGVYFTFLIAVILVSVFCGLGPSLVAALSGAVLSTYFFVEPRYSLMNFTLDTQLPVMMGLSAAILSSLVSEALRATAVENERLFRLARESEIRKDEFLAMASHEIRAPLAPIRNALYYLRRSETTEEERADVCDLLERQVELLVRLVDDLLDVSRITRGRIVLREESTPLSRIVENAVELARPLIEERGHKLTVKLPDDLVWVRVDFVRMVQVIANLLNNAAKFSSWRGQVWLTAERTANGELLIRVRDDGVGISAEMLPRIFDLFEQADRSTARTEGGLGVGLTVVKAIAELHGGSVRASSPGRTHGAEFTVSLPAHRVLGDAEPDRNPPPVDTSPIVRKRRVLIVDDNRPTANSLATILRVWGHEVSVAHDGFAALEAATKFQPQVVLADVGLPRMDGYELARQLRLLPGLENVALIAVTGYGQDSDIRLAEEAGFNHHLLKPLDPCGLERMLARV